MPLRERQGMAIPAGGPTAFRRKAFCIKFTQHVQISTKPAQANPWKPLSFIRLECFGRKALRRELKDMARLLLKLTESETVFVSFLVVPKLLPLPVNSAVVYRRREGREPEVYATRLSKSA